MPMVALGLKETKEIDFREPFKDFILEHYSEDGGIYEDAIAEFMDVRQVSKVLAGQGYVFACILSTRKNNVLTYNVRIQSLE